MIAVVSDLTMLELEYAPKEVRDTLSSIPQAHIERVQLTQEALDLAKVTRSSKNRHSLRML